MAKFKVTLDCGPKPKVVVIRKMLIADQRTAARALGKGMNDAEMMLAMQDEIIKMIIISIDGKKLKGVEKENLDKILEYSEYMQLMEPVKEMMGNVSAPKVEIITDDSQEQG